MRTTLDIDEDLLRATKELARHEGTTAGQVVSRLLRRSLTGGDVGQSVAPTDATVGFLPFAARPGVVTSLSQVNALRDAEGI